MLSRCRPLPASPSSPTLPAVLSRCRPPPASPSSPLPAAGGWATGAPARPALRARAALRTCCRAFSATPARSPPRAPPPAPTALATRWHPRPALARARPARAPRPTPGACRNSTSVGRSRAPSATRRPALSTSHPIAGPSAAGELRAASGGGGVVRGRNVPAGHHAGSATFAAAVRSLRPPPPLPATAACSDRMRTEIRNGRRYCCLVPSHCPFIFGRDGWVRRISMMDTGGGEGPCGPEALRCAAEPAMLSAALRYNLRMHCSLPLPCRRKSASAA